VQVFSRRGYHAASMERSPKLAGISKPMVYAYLGNKEQLFIACLRREGARVMAAVAEVAPFDFDGPVESSSTAAARVLPFVAEHRDTWAVLHNQGRRQEPFGSVIAEIRLRWIEAIAAGLRKGTSPRRTSCRPRTRSSVRPSRWPDWLVEQEDGDPSGWPTAWPRCSGAASPPDRSR
jgi:AcrR family transcriptional regulator